MYFDHRLLPQLLPDPPLPSLIRLLDKEWRQEVGGVEKRRGKGPCSTGRSCQGQGWSPRESSQESKLQIKDLGSALLWFYFEPARATGDTLKDIKSPLPHPALHSQDQNPETATVNNGSRLRSIVSCFTVLCNLPLFSPSGPSPNLHFTLMSPTPNQNHRICNKDQTNIEGKAA